MIIVGLCVASDRNENPVESNEFVQFSVNLLSIAFQMIVNCIRLLKNSWLDRCYIYLRMIQSTFICFLMNLKSLVLHIDMW
jgi:hypothetical protein